MTHFSSDDHILHLIDTDDVSCCATTLALLSDLVSRQPQHTTICLIGSGWSRQQLRELGLNRVSRLRLPFGQRWSLHHALRRFINATNHAIDVIHCWSDSAKTLAVKAVTHIPVVVTLTQHTPDGVKPVNRGVLYLPIHEGIADDLHNNLGAKSACVPLWPGYDLKRLASAEQRNTIRMALGVSEESETIIYLLGDPVHRVDALRAVWALGLVCSAGESIRIVVSPNALNRARAQHALRGAGFPNALITHPLADEPWNILPACDLCFSVDGPLKALPGSPMLHEPAEIGVSGGLSVGWCMLSGIPVVGENTLGFATMLDAQPDEKILLPTGLPRKQAQILRDLIRNPAEAKTLGTALQIRAQSMFSLNHYVQSMNWVYQSLIRHVPLKIPAMNLPKVVDQPTRQTS